MSTVIQHIHAQLVRERNDNVNITISAVECLRHLQANYLPRGSGIDLGTTVVGLHKGAVVFSTSFHHMNEVGFYDGWTEHKITVTPTFDGMDIRISGKDRNGIKDYLHDVFYHALTVEIPDDVWHAVFMESMQ